MDNKLQEIVDVYNDRQDKYDVKSILHFNGWYRVHIDIKRDDSIVVVDQRIPVIGFYEWLFNPKYRVLETLNIMTLLNITKGIGFQILIREPEEIIDYIYRGVK